MLRGSNARGKLMASASAPGGNLLEMNLSSHRGGKSNNGGWQLC